MSGNTSVGSVTILNLGSGRQEDLSAAMTEILKTAAKVHTLNTDLLAPAGLPEDMEVVPYDEILADEDNDDRFALTAAHLVEASREEQTVLVLTDATAGKREVLDELFRLGAAGRCRLCMFDAHGNFGILLAAAGLNFAGPFSVTAPADLMGRHHPPFSPAAAALLPNLVDAVTAGQVKKVLGNVYPPEHPVRVVRVSPRQEISVQDVALAKLDKLDDDYGGAALIVPPLAPEQSFEAFAEIIAHLRAPEGCPWDREQTHLSLRKNLLEETYEALSALDDEDVDGMREEFGDLMLQIVLHAQIATEAGEFRMGDVLEGINRKLVHRHPHVFGEERVSGVKGVLQNWEKLKEEERAAKGQAEKGQLDGVPVALPALNQAQEIQSRAARVGFDWGEIKPVLEKVFEEIEEVQSARTPEEREKEIGDVFFALVNLARWHKVDAESALRLTNLKFRKRFAYIEKEARLKGVRLADMTLAEMDVLWEEAKGLE